MSENGGERFGLGGEKEEWRRGEKVIKERLEIKEAERMEEDGLRKRNRRKQEKTNWGRRRMNRGNGEEKESDVSDGSRKGNK